MPGCHRNGDSRYCGAATIVSGQSTVFVNNRLWAVNGDPDTHDGAPLEAVYPSKNVYIQNILVICAPGDHAGAEPIPPFHGPPATWPAGHSDNTYVYSGGGGG